MNPKRHPKSELPLSAAPQVDRWLSRTRDAILAIVVLSLLIFLGGLQGVKAADHVCPTIRPCQGWTTGPFSAPEGQPVSRSAERPTVAGVPVPPRSGTPAINLPNTDTEGPLTLDGWVLVLIWAIVVATILLIWHAMAYHDD